MRCNLYLYPSTRCFEDDVRSKADMWKWAAEGYDALFPPARSARQAEAEAEVALGLKAKVGGAAGTEDGAA